jgi:hypothetical protein
MVWSVAPREEHRLRVFENRVSMILGSKMDVATGEWGRLYNEELHDLYCSPNIIRMGKSRRMMWVGHEVHMGAYRVWWGNLRERDHLEDLGIDGRIV